MMNLEIIDKRMFTVGKISLGNLQTGTIVTKGTIDTTLAGLLNPS